MEEPANQQNATDLTENVKILCKVSSACKKWEDWERVRISNCAFIYVLDVY